MEVLPLLTVVLRMNAAQLGSELHKSSPDTSRLYSAGYCRPAQQPPIQIIDASILQSYLMSIICLENVFKVFINSIKYPIQIFCGTELGCFVTV